MRYCISESREESTSRAKFSHKIPCLVMFLMGSIMSFLLGYASGMDRNNVVLRKKVGYMNCTLNKSVYLKPRTLSFNILRPPL